MSSIGGRYSYNDRSKYDEYRAMLNDIEIEWCSGCGSYRSVVHRHTGRGAVTISGKRAGRPLEAA